MQEIFGLSLTGDTRHQKAFLLVGPKRSGKGTIERILTMLVGRANVCGAITLAVPFFLAFIVILCRIIGWDGNMAYLWLAGGYLHTASYSV